MIKKIGAMFIIAVSTFIVSSFVMTEDKTEATEIKWYTWEEAVKLNDKNPKKVFVDVYTEWCGWCKRMDNSTFKDSAVVAYLNENYYPVKFDAEQKEDVLFQGNTLKFDATAGRRGAHNLAIALLDGKMSYPSYVYLTSKFERITISPGYKEAKALMKELKFIAEEHYKTTTWQEYTNSHKD